MSPDDATSATPQLTLQELQIRKAFVGLGPAEIEALQALSVWMQANVHEVIEEFYTQLLRFEEPRRLLADPQGLARAKGAQTDYLLSLTAGAFDSAYVASRLAIGRVHERTGVSPQWYLGAYSLFARSLFPRLLEHYCDRPEAGVAAIKALIAAMHLDMQLGMDAYIASYHRQIEGAYAALQCHATDLEAEVAVRIQALAVRARELETLYQVSTAASQELDPEKVLEATLPAIIAALGASGGEVHLMDEEGCLRWAASHGLAEGFVQASRSLPFRPHEGIPGRAFASEETVLVEDVDEEPQFLRREAARAFGYRSLLCTPLLAHGTPIGTLQIYAQARHGLTLEMSPLVRAIAQQLAVAIANAHLHQTLKTSEAEFRSLVENTPRLIFRLDPHGRCTFVNPAIQTMLGWPAQALLRSPSMRDLLGHPDDWPEGALSLALGGKVLQGVECRLRHQDGSWRWCQLTLCPRWRGDETVVGVEGVAQDVTEQKRAAQEMARSERLALAGQLASGLAHEIGTPLNVIAGTAEYLLTDLPPGDPKRADLEIISQETHRVADLVRRLLGLVRERDEPRTLVELDALLDHTLRLLEYRFQKEKITVVKQYAAGLPPVLGVRAQLEQVFLNLLVNAWQAMPDGGRITVGTRGDGEQAVVEIRDTGCGIPEEHLGRLFEPFFTTKSPEQGTGLGLAVTHRLITMHGGRIEIASQVNEGTTAIITLPLAAGGQHG
ncbi:MAG: PAS domain S-box protein [Nitrospinae bacterium]|nr:PAS domain S-box protein [Nitrospinota bacterium]